MTSDSYPAELPDGWTKTDEGWDSDDGYTITVQGAHGRFAALRGDGTTIVMNLVNFDAALWIIEGHRDSHLTSTS